MRSWHLLTLFAAFSVATTGCEKSQKDAEAAPKPAVNFNPVPLEQSVATPVPDPAPAPDTPPKYSERTKQFLEAAEKGRISLMLEFLKQGADVNDKDDEGQTALHKAVAAGHRSAVVALLTYGADMGEKDAKGRTPLMVAAENGHAQLVSILTNPDTVKNLAGEALKAVDGESLKAVGLPNFANRMLELVGSSIDLPDQTGQTALMKAAANGHLEVVKALVNRADPNRRDRHGKTALMLAAAGGHAQMVEYLASLAQLTTEKILTADKDNKTALDLATAAGHKNVVLALRQALLVKASGEGQLALVRSVLDSKEFPEPNAAEGMKAAARNGAILVVRYFMDKWKDKSVEERQRLMGMPVNGYDGTALAYASMAGNKQMVDALLDVAWWKEKSALLDYLMARIYGVASVESVYGQSAEMATYLKARREALQAELKK